jgi:sodium pump decarboxylase gamma subunit
MTNLLSAGLQLTLTGMTAVFALLGILVLTVRQMSRLARFLEQRYGIPTIEPSMRVPAAPASTAPRSDLDEELVTVICAAVHRFRQSHRTL